MAEAWRIHSLGIAITLDEYSDSLPAKVRDDLVLIKDAIAVLEEAATES